jgi:hypothetical protein
MPVSEPSLVAEDSPTTISPLLTPHDSAIHNIRLPLDVSNRDVNVFHSQDSTGDGNNMLSASLQNSSANKLTGFAIADGQHVSQDIVLQDPLACDQVDFHLLSATDESTALSVNCHLTHNEITTETVSSPNTNSDLPNADLLLSVPSSGAGCHTQQVIHSPASSIHSDRSDQSSDMMKSQSLTLSGGITSEELATGDQVGVFNLGQCESKH